MFPPIFPISIRALQPLAPYATSVWLAGVVCLWLTRYTHQFGRRWGVPYYAFSAVVRPTGVLLIGMGWLALYAAVDPVHLWEWGVHVPWLGRGSVVDLLCAAAVVALFGLGIWSVYALGLRRTFLYRHVDDRLVTSGPYALVRHPQFLLAIGMTLFGAILYNPLAWPWVGPTVPVHTNWLLMTTALWLLSGIEDRELAAHFGAEYEHYARRVPRLFPN